ncbi:MAG TPA: YdhR family protein [Miltoncostaea sp.]|nr:YdhR family protein [Miltoncostaea sp.]
MHVQIVTFTLSGIDEDGYRAACAEMAPAFAALPGLQAKIWLTEPATGTYGGVYLWDDRASMEAYAVSELFASVAASPAFAGIASRDFGVLEDLTRRTQPGLDVLHEPAATA